MQFYEALKEQLKVALAGVEAQQRALQELRQGKGGESGTGQKRQP